VGGRRCVVDDAVGGKADSVPWDALHKNKNKSVYVFGMQARTMDEMREGKGWEWMWSLNL
jgi:hypothetical protein